MNTHDGDSIEDPWQRATDQWNNLAGSLKAHYRELAGDGGPSQEDVAAALRTLGHAAQQVTDSVGQALRNPESRDQIKSVASSFLAAIGRTISELGEELKRGGGEEE